MGKAMQELAERSASFGRKSTVIVDRVSKTFEGGRGRKSFEVLRDVSLEVYEGEFLAIIGPSGCGKSTLLSVVAGYAAVDAGQVLVDGSQVSGPGSQRVMVFQRPTLFPWLSASENVAFGLKLGANRKMVLDRAMLASRTNDLLDMVGLRSFASHYPFELSGGMQQRIEIARALAVRPQVLLMDEPFGALDALTRRSMQTELAEIHAKTGCTTLFVTHDVYEAIVLADRVAVMSAKPGRIREIVPVNLDRSLRRDSVQALDLARRMSELLHEEGT